MPVNIRWWLCTLHFPCVIHLTREYRGWLPRYSSAFYRGHNLVWKWLLLPRPQHCKDWMIPRTVLARCGAACADCVRKLVDSGAESGRAAKPTSPSRFLFRLAEALELLLFRLGPSPVWPGPSAWFTPGLSASPGFSRSRFHRWFRWSR